MIQVSRIVELQSKMYGYHATQHEERAVALELLIESTKPKNAYAEWHDLIATPFRYSPPYPIARFRPLYAKNNVFYASLNPTTSFYEYSFHFIRERAHLPIKRLMTDIGRRTLFSVNANDASAVHIKHHKQYKKIMDKNDYQFSHQFIDDHPENVFILYPSCRDPHQGDNAAILDIQLLDKQINSEKSISYFYDNKKKILTWMDKKLHIQWSEVR